MLPLLHSVSAWACGLRSTLGLGSVSEKSNEIPAVHELINVLDLEGTVVTADVMHCQREAAKAIIDKNDGLHFGGARNQPALENALSQSIVDAFDEDNPEIRCRYTMWINLGREEYREVSVLPCPKNSSVFSNGPGLRRIGVTFRSREINGVLEESLENSITNLPCKVCDISKRIRRHWG